MTSQIKLIQVDELPNGNINITFDDGTGTSWVSRADLEAETNRRLDVSTNSLIWLCINKYLQSNTYPVTAILDTDNADGNVVKVM